MAHKTFYLSREGIANNGTKNANGVVSGTDASTSIQAILNQAVGGGGLTLVWDTATVAKGLNYYGNTEIIFTRNGWLYLPNMANTYALRNGNAVGLSLNSIVDTNVTIVGANIELNGSACLTGSPNLSVTAPNQYIRSSGSFVTDGFQVGDYLMASGFSSTANNFTNYTAPLTITAVNSGTVTISGATLVNETAASSRNVTAYHQSHNTQPTQGTSDWVVGIAAYGVAGLKMYGCSATNSRTFAAHIINAQDVKVDNLIIANSARTVDNNNDGLHINGPFQKGYVNSLTYAGYDDSLGIGADDDFGGGFSSFFGSIGGGGQSGGTVTGLAVNNVILKGGYEAVRLMSITSLLDDVQIDGVYGNKLDNLGNPAIIAGNLGQGTYFGNFGRWSAKNITVDGGYAGDSQGYVRVEGIHQQVDIELRRNDASNPQRSLEITSNASIQQFSLSMSHNERDSSLGKVANQITIAGTVNHMDIRKAIWTPSTGGYYASAALVSVTGKVGVLSRGDIIAPVLMTTSSRAKVDMVEVSEDIQLSWPGVTGLVGIVDVNPAMVIADTSNKVSTAVNIFGNNATSSGAARPTLGSFNGFPTLNFTTNQYLTMPISSTSTCTFVAVIDVETQGAYSTLFDSTNGTRVLVNDANAGNPTLSAGSNMNTTAVTGNLKVFVGVFNGASSFAYLNATKYTGNPGSNALLTDLVIGNDQGKAADFLGGRLFRFALFSGAATDAQAQWLRDRMNSIYRIY